LAKRGITAAMAIRTTTIAMRIGQGERRRLRRGTTTFASPGSVVF